MQLNHIKARHAVYVRPCFVETVLQGTKRTLITETNTEIAFTKPIQVCVGHRGGVIAAVRHAVCLSNQPIVIYRHAVTRGQERHIPIRVGKAEWITPREAAWLAQGEGFSTAHAMLESFYYDTAMFAERDYWTGSLLMWEYFPFQ